MDLSSISDGKWLAGRIPEQNFAHRCLGVFTLSPDMEKLEKYSDKDLVVKSKKLFGAVNPAPSFLYYYFYHYHLFFLTLCL